MQRLCAAARITSHPIPISFVPPSSLLPPPSSFLKSSTSSSSSSLQTQPSKSYASTTTSSMAAMQSQSQSLSTNSGNSLSIGVGNLPEDEFSVEVNARIATSPSIFHFISPHLMWKFLRELQTFPYTTPSRELFLMLVL
ncbi:hypothetical protein BVRB_8g194910 [Beta vulgaris subsp. vulgaris]|nr:hypothetical protein BVRB_8g194910 [Beta vulgaris subsp. vulgaris]